MTFTRPALSDRHLVATLGKHNLVEMTMITSAMLHSQSSPLLISSGRAGDLSDVFSSLISKTLRLPSDTGHPVSDAIPQVFSRRTAGRNQQHMEKAALQSPEPGTDGASRIEVHFAGYAGGSFGNSTTLGINFIYLQLCSHVCMCE